jgi:TonB family protein
VATKHLRVRVFSSLIWVALLGSAMSRDGPGLVEIERKCTERVIPSYPELARKTNITGIVKAEALVTADGRVKSVVMKGGNPLLIQAAQHAIYQWKWAPAKHETRETIEIRFDPAH